MKTYTITILTASGPVKIIYKDSEPLEQYQARILKQYGTFTTLKAIQIN